MSSLGLLLFWLAVSVYALSFIFYLVSFVFKKERADVFAFYLIVFAFVIHTIYIAQRWIESGHPPVVGRFENSLWGTWFVVLIALILFFRRKGSRNTGVVISPFVLLMLGNGLVSGDLAIEPLSPPFKSGWLWVHVIFSWLAYGSYTVSAGLATVYLLKRGGSIAKIVLEDLIVKFIAFGFISHIVMVGSGAVWAYGLWGRYWAWDPLETWSLISWLIYGLILHLRLTLGWKGKRIAWLAIISLLGIIILFWGIGFVSELHTGLL